jgi:NAD(P)-dependent dehydrogenase (short-subunit alcohol dehydrogenase family)
MARLEGRCAVVTGGGGGIGRAVARALAAEGAAVVLAGRTAAPLEQAAAELRGSGHMVTTVVCDVTDESQVATLAQAAPASRRAPVDILINNAGVAHSAPLGKITLEDWNRVFAVNATGTFLCTRAFVPAMVERGWGRVVNVASVAGVSGAKYIAAYTAAKHAVVGFTRSVAAEVAARGVTVNAVCPSYVDTGMTDESIRRIVEKTGRSPEEAKRAILEATPQRRLIPPEEVAHAVLALVDPQAASINGTTLVMDGGALLA